MRLIEGDFQDRVGSWIRGRAAEQFSFLHKPPGLRLCLLGRREGVMPLLCAELDNLVKDDVIRSWSRGFYEPEAYQFGGELGLEVAHEFFTEESLAVLAYHRLRLRGGVALDRAEFSLLLLDEFLRQVVEDESELLDLWCNMALTGRLPDPPGSGSQGDIQAAEAVRGAFLPLLRDHYLVLERMTDAELRPAPRIPIPTSRNRHPSPPGGGIGFPALGVRTILPFWIIFHWNRMGFDLVRQRRLAFLMTRILHPKF